MWGRKVRLKRLEGKVMADLANLQAAVTKLTADVQALIAAGGNDQAGVDAVTASLTQLDATVVAATTPSAAPAA